MEQQQFKRGPAEVAGSQPTRPRWRLRFSSTTIAWLSFAVLCLSGAWWLIRH